MFSADIVWNGGNGYWGSAAEWTPATVPSIRNGTDTATIGAGIVTNIAVSDWTNNSTVTITNNATWIQNDGHSWIRAAGSGTGNSGTLILRDSAEFNSGSASWRFVIGVQGGNGIVQVNDSATLNARCNLALGSLGPNSRGVLDVNGGYVKVNNLWFSCPDTGVGKALNTYGRVNISGGRLEAIGGDSITFYGVDDAGYDHAINFDGSEGSVITHGTIGTSTNGVRSVRSWRDLYGTGILLRNGSNTVDFDECFYVGELASGAHSLSLKKPVVWKGGVGSWHTNLNWVGEVVPDIHSGSNSVYINAGEVQYAASGDWSNNSFVCLSNNATWTQTSGHYWIRIAGNGNKKAGVLSLNGSSKFNAGTAGRVVVGIFKASGVIRVNDSATLDTGIRVLNLAYGQNTSGVIDLNGGIVKVRQLWFTEEDSGSDGFGTNTFGRVYVSGGVLEATDNGDCVKFQNISASGYDHAIDFDGAGGSIITRGPLITEEGANIAKRKSWEELYTTGFLLRNGSNTNSFSSHFVVKDLGSGGQELSLRSYRGTVITIL